VYDVELDNQPRRFLKKIPDILAGRITEKLKEFQEQPIPSDAKKVIGTDYWRARVGDYRILYVVHHDKQEVVVSRIEHRSRGYDRIT
jgi:mRNA interferase RelE/StbE